MFFDEADAFFGKRTNIRAAYDKYANQEETSKLPICDWRRIVAYFELTGDEILNITHHCALEVLADQFRSLDLKRLEAAILREYIKEEKVV